MIRPLPFDWLAPAQRDEGCGPAMRSSDIRYRIFQLSLKLAVRHNVPVSSIFLEKIDSSPFAIDGLFFVLTCTPPI
jgi:hypothetical protein